MANVRTTGPEPLTERRREILDTIIEHQRGHGYPPSIREICAANGLKSPAAAKHHLDVLKAAGYLKIAADKPRAITVCYDSHTGAAAERRPARHVPLVVDLAAGSAILTAGNNPTVSAGASRSHRPRRAVHAAHAGIVDVCRRDP